MQKIEQPDGTITTAFVFDGDPDVTDDVDVAVPHHIPLPNHDPENEQPRRELEDDSSGKAGLIVRTAAAIAGVGLTAGCMSAGAESMVTTDDRVAIIRQIDEMSTATFTLDKGVNLRSTPQTIEASTKGNAHSSNIIVTTQHDFTITRPYIIAGNDHDMWIGFYQPDTKPTKSITEAADNIVFANFSELSNQGLATETGGDTNNPTIKIMIDETGTAITEGDQKLQNPIATE